MATASLVPIVKLPCTSGRSRRHATTPSFAKEMAPLEVDEQQVADNGQYVCVIRSMDRKILMVRVGEGRWRMPAIDAAPHNPFASIQYRDEV